MHLNETKTIEEDDEEVDSDDDPVDPNVRPFFSDSSIQKL